MTVGAGRDPLDLLAGLPPGGAPPPSVALEALLADLPPVAPRRPRRQLAVLAGVSLVIGAGVLAVVSLRRDLGELPLAWIVGAALAWATAFGATATLALVPRPGAMLPRTSLATAAATITAAGFVLLGVLIHPSGPSSVSLGAAGFWRGHGCLELGLASALVPVLVGVVLLRGMIPVGARGVAAALGAVGGSIGGLVLHLHCPITDALHQGVIHGGVVVIAALLAAALAPRAIELR